MNFVREFHGCPGQTDFSYHLDRSSNEWCVQKFNLEPRSRLSSWVFYMFNIFKTNRDWYQIWLASIFILSNNTRWWGLEKKSLHKKEAPPHQYHVSLESDFYIRHWNGVLGQRGPCKGFWGFDGSDLHSSQPETSVAPVPECVNLGQLPLTTSVSSSVK